MAGLFRRLLGMGKKAEEDHVADRDTQAVKASQVAPSDSRVKTIRSEEMDSVEKNKRSLDDISPWHIGKTVGEIFEIRGVLGHGGMGIVYRALDKATEREVAVKLPLGSFVDNENARKRFAREAQTWIELIHPHIVRAFLVRDDQATDYRPAIFMDYCDGGSLADRLHCGVPLSMIDALDIAIQVCWALGFAHEKGHVHRDLKPGNILLTSKGTALVSDFGLAKQINLEDLDVDEAELTRLDGELHSMLTLGAAGTPEYMPPEQWEGNANKRSDIYAFGIVLYEIICGGRPFTAKRRAGLRKVHAMVPPPDPKKLNGDIPDALSELMLECVAKDPKDRPSGFDRVSDRLISIYKTMTKALSCDHCRKKPDTENITRAEKRAQGMSLTLIGNGCSIRGDHSEATRCYEESIKILKDLGDRHFIANCHIILGTMARTLGNDGMAMHENPLNCSRLCEFRYQTIYIRLRKRMLCLTDFQQTLAIDLGKISADIISRQDDSATLTIHNSFNI